MNDGTIGPGHNLPPDPLLVEAAERTDAANRWLTERADIAAWDAEVADRASFFVSQIDATYKALDGRRLEEKRVFLADQDRVYKAPLSLLDRAKAAVSDLRRAWLRKEQARLDTEQAAAKAEADRKAKEAAEAAKRAAEESSKKGGDPLRAELAAQQAAREAEEAAQKAAAAPAKAQIKGTYTTTAKGLSTVWSAEITDAKKAWPHYKSRPEVQLAIREAMLKCAIADAKKLKDEKMAPDGVKFTKEMK